MTEFSPGEQKVATITMSNPTTKAFDYVAELFLGIDAVVSSSQSFHLEAGESKNISFSITMPSVMGVYPVYISVMSGGIPIILYSAGDVTIAGAAEFYMPAAMTVVVTGDGQILDIYWDAVFTVVITNNGSVAGTHILTISDSYQGLIGTIQLTLQPGESYTWRRSQWVNFRAMASYTVYLVGDWVGNNTSQGTATP